jgi:hypothetical protein
MNFTYNSYSKISISIFSNNLSSLQFVNYMVYALISFIVWFRIFIIQNSNIDYQFMYSKIVHYIQFKLPYIINTIVIGNGFALT